MGCCRTSPKLLALPKSNLSKMQKHQDVEEDGGFHERKGSACWLLEDFSKTITLVQIDLVRDAVRWRYRGDRGICKGKRSVQDEIPQHPFRSTAVLDPCLPSRRSFVTCHRYEKLVGWLKHHLVLGRLLFLLVFGTQGSRSVCRFLVDFEKTTDLSKLALSKVR